MACAGTMCIYRSESSRLLILSLSQYSIAFLPIAAILCFDWYLPISVVKCHLFHHTRPSNIISTLFQHPSLAHKILWLWPVTALLKFDGRIMINNGRRGHIWLRLSWIGEQSFGHCRIRKHMMRKSNVVTDYFRKTEFVISNIIRPLATFIERYQSKHSTTARGQKHYTILTWIKHERKGTTLNDAYRAISFKAQYCCCWAETQYCIDLSGKVVVAWSSPLDIYIQRWHIPKVGVYLLIVKCDNEQDPEVPVLLRIGSYSR